MKHSLLALAATLFVLHSHAQKIPLINSQEALKKATVHEDSGKYDLAIKELLTIPGRDTNYVAAQSRLATAYFNNKQLDLALSTAESVLKRRSEFKAAMLETKAKVYETRGEYDKSLASLQSSLQEYPFDVYLRYLVARTHHNSRNYKAAVTEYFETMKLSPFTYNIHANLASLAILTGRKTEAMLSLAMYVALVPTDNAKLQFLDNLANNEITDESTSDALKDVPNAFERLDQILRSKIALDKKFKTTVPIDVPTVKQFEMLFQQLNTASATNTDPWVEAYLPVFNAIRDQKMIEPFIYHLLSSSNIEAVAKWNSKNEKKRQAFFELVNSILSEKRSTVKLPPSLNMGATAFAEYFDSQRLYGIGQMSNGQRTGKWIYYYLNSERSAEGTYKDGKKAGVWKYYNNDGTPGSIENEDTGEIKILYPDGVTKSEYTLKNENVDGEIVFYYPCGSISEKRMQKDGKRWGKGQLMYESGVVKADFEYVDNKLVNTWIDYDVYGHVKEKTPYKDHQVDGVQEQYWPNGKLKERETFAAGVQDGINEGFHDNGKLQYKGMNTKGLSTGEWLYYDRRGVLKERRWYNAEGNVDKENIYYYQGKMSARFTYANGMLVKAEYFDPSGKQLSSYGSPDGNFEVKQLYETGQLLREGKYKAGQRDGKWTQYNVDGTISTVYNYSEGNFHGEQIDYHKNGKKKIQSTYVDGVRNGYVQEFYYNGQVSREGWIIDGQMQQQWIDYFIDGSVSYDYYFLNDASTDSAYVYSVDGSIASRYFFEDGTMVSEVNSNPIQRTFALDKNTSGPQAVKFVDGTKQMQYEVKCGKIDGTLQRFYPDGTPYYKYDYANGVLTGEYNGFDEFGKPDVKGKYVDGQRTGMWTFMNELGKPDQDIWYSNGLIDSTLVNYYEFGGVYNTAPYVGDERTGVVQIFAPNGQPVVEKRYNVDEIVAFRMTGKNGQFGDWKPVSQKFSIVAYYANGQKAYEENYSAGTISGVKRIYFPDGKICKEYNFVDGENEGPFSDYYPNGKLSMKGQYVLGELDGVVEVFDENGMPLKTSTYKHGKRNGTTTLFTKGVKSKEVTYFNGIPMK